jgi:hypothetical protein
MAIGTVDLYMGYIQIMWKPITILGNIRVCTDAGVFLLTMFFFDTGAILGGHVRAVFTLITFIFTICVAITVTSFKEIPLHLLESQEQVRGDLQKRDGLSSVNAVVTETDRWTSPENGVKNSNRCW